MNLLVHTSSLALWQDVIQQAEDNCSVSLKKELEAYLVSLLMRYMNRPELAKQFFAMAFLEAVHLQENARRLALQHLGDQCLIFSGLFPRVVEKKHVKISYFVDMGRTAYAAISSDLYHSLAIQFVLLMDVLQSIRPSDVLPLDAYELWNDVGSQRALKILQSCSKGLPFKI